MLDLRKRLIERRNVELSPDLAKHYLNFNTYSTQRALRPHHVNDLAKKMVQGLFRYAEVSFASYLNADIMINGQHQCQAIIKSGETYPCVLEKFRVENARELSEAYRQFEYLPRSLREMIKVEAEALGVTWPLWVSSLVVSAAGLLNNISNTRFSFTSGVGSTNERNAITKDVRVQYLAKYLLEGDFIASVLTFEGNAKATRTSVKHLARAAVVAIMIKTYRKDSEDATIFWQNTRDGEGLRKDMPEMQLREFLIKSGLYGCQQGSFYRKVTNHELAYRSIIAWNAVRSNSKTNLKYMPSKALPPLK